MTDKNSEHLEVTVRRALKGDKTAVLEAASGAFNGFDYLPYSYDHVIDDPSHVYFLAEVDGQVVGFYGGCLTDGGLTLTLRSARVKTQFRNRRILIHILRAIYREFATRQRAPVDVFFSMNNLSALVSKPSLQTSCNILLRRDFLIFTTVATGLSLQSFGHANGQPEESVTELDVDSFIRFLGSLDEAGRTYLFPEGYFLVGGWHFRLIPENREIIKRMGIFISASDSLLQPTTVPGGRQQGVMLSACSHCTMTGAICTTTHIFGQPDDASLMPHLRRLVTWVGGQVARHGLEEDAERLFRISFCTKRVDASDIFRQFGFVEKQTSSSMQKMYFQQDFDSLGAI